MEPLVATEEILRLVHWLILWELAAVRLAAAAMLELEMVVSLARQALGCFQPLLVSVVQVGLVILVLQVTRLRMVLQLSVQLLPFSWKTLVRVVELVVVQTVEVAVVVLRLVVQAMRHL
jgi:hypothetical protein